MQRAHRLDSGNTGKRRNTACRKETKGLGFEWPNLHFSSVLFGAFGPRNPMKVVSVTALFSARGPLFSTLDKSFARGPRWRKARFDGFRSEERRVGKELRCWWASEH